LVGIKEDRSLPLSCGRIVTIESAFMTRTFWMLVLLATSLPAYGGPCLTTTTPCTEWVNLGNGPSRSLIYRTYALGEKNEGITRALIVVHGAGRDADNYFRSALAATFLAGALDDTIVISPRFASNDGNECKDILAANEVNWPCNGDSWRSGGTALNDEKLGSFDFADELLRRLARKDMFPNLKTIVMSGHSAGGQFVTRYEMANQVHDTLGVPVSYVVANPSSYAYVDPERPSADAKQLQPFRDARNCTAYDNWPYGLKQRSGYSAKLTDNQLKKQLAARAVTYMLGELDTLPIAGFDSSCPAMAQGPNRLARGQAYANYVNQKYNAPHKTIVIPLCGHNARCMFTAEPALPVLFPRP
jgi:pimeloyl-ACP methyl ester carboxylesterase